MVATDSVRTVEGAGGPSGADADRSDVPLVTWPELRQLSASGRVDVQSHSWSHSMIFAGEHIVGAVDATFAGEPPLNHPRLNVGDPPEFLDSNRVGYPVFPRRSRLSDARRFLPDEDACARAAALSAGQAGSAGVVGRIHGRWETEYEQNRAIEHELVASRDAIQAGIGAPVRHMCLPWGVSGERTRASLARLGFVSAFANRWAGQFVVAPGDDPFFLKRLHSKHILALPGRGRRSFTMLA
jgi:hypothetical protein